MARKWQSQKLIFIVAITIMFSLFMHASIGFAADQPNSVTIQSVKIDQASGFVTIHGKIGSGSGKQVTISITDPSGKLDYMNQTTSGAEGFFAFTYVPSELRSGEYYLQAGGEGVNTPYQSSIRLKDVLGSAVLKGPDVIQTKQQFDIVFGLSGVKEDVMAQDMTIVFDESRLEFISAHSLQEDAFTIVDYKQLAGKLRLLSVHKQDLVSDKNLDYMKLTFKVREEAAAGAANVAVSEIIIADSHGVETELQGASHSTVVGVIDKAALNALLAEARIIHDAAVEGNRIGQYPAGSKAALEQVLRSTALVAADVNASHADVMEAVKALDAALQAFKDLVITSIIGDINNDQRVSIGDLAILAKSYGKTSQSPDWETIKGRDLNHDGKIDIEDLAAMARLIFNEQ